MKSHHLQVADELRELLPEVFKNHQVGGCKLGQNQPLFQLVYAWAYKYAQGSNGIGIHADDAAVNVNLWITEDEQQVLCKVDCDLLSFSSLLQALLGGWWCTRQRQTRVWLSRYTYRVLAELIHSGYEFT